MISDTAQTALGFFGFDKLMLWGWYDKKRSLSTGLYY